MVIKDIEELRKAEMKDIRGGCIACSCGCTCGCSTCYCHCGEAFMHGFTYMYLDEYISESSSVEPYNTDVSMSFDNLTA